ncbi:MAG TPA: primosomal protein, partial [Pseudonocardiaceae bacterium]|nr:primosomal protein [Pseudonocardiaceae bacterium]
PPVDEAALATAQVELAELEAQLSEEDDEEEAAEGEETDSEDDETEAAADSDAAETEAAVEEEEPEPLGFWGEAGIDPIKIITTDSEVYTLRCYLDDEPLFLGADGQIDVFRSPKALARFVADAGADEGNDLAQVVTWDQVLAAAVDGSLKVEIDPGNTYVLPGIADDISDGPDTVDPTQLELAVELLSDAADWAGDDGVNAALSQSEPLGWLVSFVLRPDPSRLAPSAPFDKEETAWKTLVESFEGRLRKH